MQNYILSSLIIKRIFITEACYILIPNAVYFMSFLLLSCQKVDFIDFSKELTFMILRGKEKENIYDIRIDQTYYLFFYLVYFYERERDIKISHFLQFFYSLWLYRFQNSVHKCIKAYYCYVFSPVRTFYKCKICPFFKPVNVLFFTFYLV